MQIIPSEGLHTRIAVNDETGPGGAHHCYIIEPDPVKLADQLYNAGIYAQINFQKGPIHEEGINGCTIEDLLTIVMHRLHSFQGGSHPCRENQVALDHLVVALACLISRTQERREQGIEGTNQHRKTREA